MWWDGAFSSSKYWFSFVFVVLLNNNRLLNIKAEGSLCGISVKGPKQNEGIVSNFDDNNHETHTGNKKENTIDYIRVLCNYFLFLIKKHFFFFILSQRIRPRRSNCILNPLVIFGNTTKSIGVTQTTWMSPWGDTD